jgi:hypothetical protein
MNAVNVNIKKFNEDKWIEASEIIFRIKENLHSISQSQDVNSQHKEDHVYSIQDIIQRHNPNNTEELNKDVPLEDSLEPKDKEEKSGSTQQSEEEEVQSGVNTQQSDKKKIN